MFFAIKSAKKTTKKYNQNFLTNQIKKINVQIWIVNQTLRLKLEQQRGKEQKYAG